MYHTRMCVGDETSYINPPSERLKEQSIEQLEMGKSTQKAHWAFTLVQPVFDLESIEQSTEATPIVAKVDNRPEEVVVHVGPIEGSDKDNTTPHRHGMVSLKGGRGAMTKAKAKKFLSRVLDLDAEKISYFQPVENKLKYLQYIYKSLLESSNDPDVVIATAVAGLRQSGRVTKAELMERLIAVMGIKWTARHEREVKTALSSSSVDPRTEYVYEIPDSELTQNVKYALDRWMSNIQRALEKSSFQTEHIGFQDWTKEHIAIYLRFVCLLPIYTKRRPVSDELAMPLFWGKPGTGKSFIFHAANHSWKGVASDAAGVSRFTLVGSQHGLVFDDAKVKQIFAPSNETTIKQLATGAVAVVKTNGDVVETRGFVAITSNDDLWQPADPLLEITTEALHALRRRFIFVQFTEEQVDEQRDVPIDLCNDVSRSVVWPLMSEVVFLPDGNIKSICMGYYNSIQSRYNY